MTAGEQPRVRERARAQLGVAAFSATASLAATAVVWLVVWWLR